jgi:hypothetical protein
VGRLRGSRGDPGGSSGGSYAKVALAEGIDGAVKFWDFEMRIEIAVAALAAAGFGGYSWWTREGRRRRRRRGANREEASEEDGEAAGNELLEQLSFAHATNEEAELSKRKAAREISRKMAARERGLQSSR